MNDEPKPAPLNPVDVAISTDWLMPDDEDMTWDDEDGRYAADDEEQSTAYEFDPTVCPECGGMLMVLGDGMYCVECDFMETMGEDA